MLDVLGAGGGYWKVPWSSRIARPEGVWRRFGRGFSEGEGVVNGRGWRGIVGIVRFGMNWGEC